MGGSRGPRLLLVEDDPTMVRVLRRNLEAHGYDIESASRGQEGLTRFAHWHPDAVLLDLGLPDMDGVTFIREVRAHSATPIVVLSAREAEGDKVAALDAGADDYLAKPFGLEELRARIRVALRRLASERDSAAARWSDGQIEVDFARRRLAVRDTEVRLTPTEWELLKVFIANAGRVISERRLLQAVWGPDYGAELHYLHVYVARLRKKLEADPQHPSILVTEPGVGYRLVAPSDQER